MDQRYAIVLSGGSGTRLWPKSRTIMPKQLLAFNGEKSLLQQTAARLLPMVKPQHMSVVINAEYRFEVIGQLHSLHPHLANRILCEPFGRNTLPAVAWAAARIARDDAEALIGVFPSDHAIENEDAFQAAWQAAESAARQGYLVLIGAKPTFAATGYGYIKAGEAIPDFSASAFPPSIFKAVRFVEKPVTAMAQEFLDTGGWLWNCGVCVFRARDFMQALHTFQPELSKIICQLCDRDTETAPEDLYGQLPEVSMDYGLLEMADQIAVVPAEMGWNDLGSWEAIYQHRGKDPQGNMIEGEVMELDCHDNLLWSERGLLATIGIRDLAVVQMGDATLVCPRQRSQEVKELIASIRAKYQHLIDAQAVVKRPWGTFSVLEEGAFYKVKRILVNPGGKLSMQMHFHRSEHWVVLSGTAKVTVGETERYLEANQSTYIAKTDRHRLENPGKIPVEIIEVQTGSYLGEDDIVRFDDVYGRAITS